MNGVRHARLWRLWRCGEAKTPGLGCAWRCSRGEERRSPFLLRPWHLAGAYVAIQICINLGFLLGRNWQLQLESARVFASTIPCLPPIASDLESSTLAEGSFERKDTIIIQICHPTGVYLIRPDQTRSDRIRSDQIRSDRIRSDQIRSNQIRSDPIRSDQILSDQIRTY
ncbi:hypothetical protein DM860_002166 [Cuscuta australis]|uniref:Uncharacterized protein n=1 Tax=Cuscuta australis TaxID=267555 RepID=A0A328DVY4_9ASTE|nr:hypothetical protein DM860_002166 [Cuscuta australis]